MTTNIPSNSPTLYVLIGSVKSDLFKVDFGNGRKTNELPNPHTFNVLHTKWPKLFLYIASGTPRYIPRYLTENRDIPWYLIFRGTQL